MSNKYYAVKKGRKTGIFRSWEECKKQVNGYSGSIFKSFKSRQEAENFIGLNKKKRKKKRVKNRVIAYVDGSYNKHDNIAGYGCVILEKDKVKAKLRGQITLKESNSKNINGELWATIKAVQWAIKNGYDLVEIRFDYLGIQNWVERRWKAKKRLTQNYVKKMDILKQDIEVKFTKVKAHSGDKYNDIADELAKQGAGLDKKIGVK